MTTTPLKIAEPEGLRDTVDALFGPEIIVVDALEQVMVLQEEREDMTVTLSALVAALRQAHDETYETVLATVRKWEGRTEA